MTHNQHYNIYIADCSPSGGIFVYDFGNGELTQKQKVSLDRPMYLCQNKDKLYCILRSPFSNSSNSGILSLAIANNGTLSNQSEPKSTEGLVSCHLCVKDGEVFNANYLSGSVNKLGEKTVAHSGKGVHPTRQEAAHTHFVMPAPDGKFLLACDLGLDTIFTYDSNLNEIARAKVPDGNGVRHLAYSADGKTVYSADELSSTISVFDYENGILNYVATVEGLPKGYQGKNTAAAIKRNGDLLYLSHRGYNGICVFDISNKVPEFITAFSSEGNSPRDFEIVGDYIIVTNEGGEVTVFGKKNFKLYQKIKLNSPLCVIKGEI